jgi:hypothetical protein
VPIRSARCSGAIVVDHGRVSVAFAGSQAMSDESLDRVIITIDDQHAADIQSVVSRLSAAGLKVSNVLSASGIVTGEVERAKRAQLRAVKGVLDVEDDQEMRAI